jgi:hypothetical protein
MSAEWFRLQIGDPEDRPDPLSREQHTSLAQIRSTVRNRRSTASVSLHFRLCRNNRYGTRDQSAASMDAVEFSVCFILVETTPPSFVVHAFGMASTRRRSSAVNLNPGVKLLRWI